MSNPKIGRSLMDPATQGSAAPPPAATPPLDLVEITATDPTGLDELGRLYQGGDGSLDRFAEAVVVTHTLDQCAEAVVAQLDGPLAEYVREIAMIHQRIPLWALVAGCLNAAYEHGTLSTPILSPSWPRSFVGVGLDLATLTYDCRWCHQAFTPQRYKQGYCSQDCGTLAAKAQAEAEREAARLAVAHG